MEFKIVGVVGQIASGKGILVNYLTSHLGFTSFSLSSIVHAELKKKGIKKFTRQTLQDVGDELRKKEGDDVLAKRAIKQIELDAIRYNQMKLEKTNSIQLNPISSNYINDPYSHMVIEGIRNPGEIEFLKKNSNFILIGVKANRELRFKRVLSRGKDWDPKNYEDFLKVDRRDLGVGQNISGQQVGKCLGYCDYVMTNNKDVKDFEGKIGKLITNIK